MWNLRLWCGWQLGCGGGWRGLDGVVWGLIMSQFGGLKYLKRGYRGSAGIGENRQIMRFSGEYKGLSKLQARMRHMILRGESVHEFSGVDKRTKLQLYLGFQCQGVKQPDSSVTYNWILRQVAKVALLQRDIVAIIVIISACRLLVAWT
uniref:Uncharacterized protein n=1 Tax=Spironucleus salmonicida TaxID=348837 RepID=V6LLW2_9EUKA|eukprot:EST44696.1 Hypothetical protein SS50377_15408 [Spironucleus salmonicida]